MKIKRTYVAKNIHCWLLSWKNYLLLYRNPFHVAISQQYICFFVIPVLLLLQSKFSLTSLPILILFCKKLNSVSMLHCRQRNTGLCFCTPCSIGTTLYWKLWILPSSNHDHTFHICPLKFACIKVATRIYLPISLGTLAYIRWHNPLAGILPPTILPQGA